MRYWKQRFYFHGLFLDMIALKLHPACMILQVNHKSRLLPRPRCQALKAKNLNSQACHGPRMLTRYSAQEQELTEDLSVAA